MANRNRKLQVFVSSTFIDLQEERQAAVQAILKVGHIPAGMELFKAGDEEQWEIIKSWIEESDVYMLILGGRYGSIEPKSGKSYTQLEYEYALELGKPFFAIVINDLWTDGKAKKKGVKIEDFKEVYNLQKLNEFRATVKTKMVSFADDLKDIKLAVSDSLHEINKREHLQGWVKADDTDYAFISQELARLSKVNSDLLAVISMGNYKLKIIINDIWHAIEQKLKDIAPDIFSSLNEGVTKDQVTQLESVIKAKLPDEFIEFYKVHNGQVNDIGGLIECEELLSFDQIEDEWKAWKDVLGDGRFIDKDDNWFGNSIPDKGIKNDWWNSLWIPLTRDGYGNCYCLDLDPTDEGKYGQIIRMWHDEYERSLVANSFVEWINTYKNKLISGQMVYSECHFGIIDKDKE